MSMLQNTLYNQKIIDDFILTLSSRLTGSKRVAWVDGLCPEAEFCGVCYVSVIFVWIWFDWARVKCIKCTVNTKGRNK